MLYDLKNYGIRYIIKHYSCKSNQKCSEKFLESEPENRREGFLLTEVENACTGN